MTKLRKILAAVLAVCMALSLAACGDVSWICEVDGETVPAGLYIYYQTEGYGDAVYNLAQEDSDTYLYPYLYYYNLGYVDPNILKDGSLSSGETVKDHINSYALDMCKQYIVVNKLFDELGLEISEAEKAVLENQARNSWSTNGATLESIGVSQSSYEEALFAQLKEDKVFDAYYEVGGKNGTTEEEVMDFFSENYARVKYMTFTFSDSIDDAIDEARKNEQLELANSYLEELNSGVPMDELIERHNAELAEAAGTDETDAEDDANAEDTADADADSAADTDAEGEDTEGDTEEEDDPYKNETVLSKDSTYPTEKFVNYVFTTVGIGDTAVVQDDTCFYVVERLDIEERSDLYEDYRVAIMQDLFDDDFTKLVNTELEKYAVAVNDKAVKKYKPENAFPDLED